MILDWLKSKLILIMGAVILTLVIWLWWVRSENEDLNRELLRIEVASEQVKARHERDTEAFDYAMKEIVKFYDRTVDDIKDFKKGANETDCDAANRVLNRFGS